VSTSEERGGRRARGGGGAAYRAAARSDVGWRQLVGANLAVDGDLPCSGPMDGIGVMRGRWGCAQTWSGGRNGDGR
jgi:hypothetical protein